MGPEHDIFISSQVILGIFISSQVILHPNVWGHLGFDAWNQQNTKALEKVHHLEFIISWFVILNDKYI